MAAEPALALVDHDIVLAAEQPRRAKTRNAGADDSNFHPYDPATAILGLRYAGCGRVDEWYWVDLGQLGSGRIEGLQVGGDGDQAGVDGQPVQHAVVEDLGGDAEQGPRVLLAAAREVMKTGQDLPGGAVSGLSAGRPARSWLRCCSVTSIRKASPMTSASNIRAGKLAALARNLSIK